MVCDVLGKKDLFLTKHPVGVDNRVQQVITMLENCQSEDVVMIGIWGMSGIGKTTIAKAICNEIGHTFESRSFLSSIREVWGQEEGQVRLQNQLLHEICQTTKTKIDGIESGKLILRDRLRHKKAIVVLDDVSELAQLYVLVGSCGWFRPGSVIIITTRDKHLLLNVGCHHVYMMETLDERESIELFSWHAFKKESPKEVYTPLSREIVACSTGLPLALEVLGSNLFGRKLQEWKNVLRRLKNIPHDDLYKKLRISFDSLDDKEKEIFLNIVLLYIGEDMNDVVQKLDGPECNASVGIRVLVDQSLVTIDENNKLRMHDILRDMGKEIIRIRSQTELRNQGHRYEVFLSFRGEDTRATFTSHLYTALCNASIIVFKDDVDLPRGNYIKLELLQAIGSSKIAIIIFSTEYAGSKWCLEELSKIMELYKSNHQVVLPVFYNVDPSEIRNQTSSFGEAFKDLIQRISPPKVQVSKWRTALAEAGSIAGIVVLNSRDESEKVKEVVGIICDKLDKKDLFVADHPVGVDNRVQEVITMLKNHKSEEVVMVGIWGMGGIGKTTIAKAIYNEIGCNFECRSYLPKIRKAWHQEEGKVRLQNQLLYEICRSTKMEIDCVDSGKITLSERLHHKKALVVLDDVDKSTQLKALVGSRDWFKPGSVIVVTSRNERLLLEMDCYVFRMKELDPKESVELFSWHAFKQESPKENFNEILGDIVEYSGRLPLALEVLGSYLFGREVKEWERVLEELKKIPNKKIQKKLKISFDGLSDQFDEKDIFLDISCFFIGMDRNDVTQILNGCGFAADIGIQTLVERTLVTIDQENKLGMHDLLRDMGREIIREESRKEPGKRSRLWSHKDARVVLLEHLGTEAIEGLSLKLPQNKNKHFQTEAFKMMKKLRLLHLEDIQLRGNYEYISRDLRWLCWHGFPVKYIPSKFCQKKLVAIDLKNNNLRQVWKERLLLKRLKILNLSHSQYLVQTPDFTQLPNLETLILKDCPSLSMIHHSIGHLGELILLDLEDCIGLHSLPRSIYSLRRLKTLILSGCKNIEKLEEDIEKMESLATLIAPTIKQAPFSLVRLKSILYLSVCGLEGLSHHVIPSLHESWISPTNNPVLRILTHAGMPSSILWDMLNSIHDHSTIPNSVLRQQSLLLEDGLEIPDSLCATNCLGHLLIQIGKNSQVVHTLSEKISQGLNPTNHNNDCTLPDDNDPYWRTIKGEGAFVKFKVPPVNCRDHLKGMTICCVYCPSSDLGNIACESCISCLIIINYTKNTTFAYTEDQLNSLEEAEKNEIISNLESDDQVEVKAVFGNGFSVKKIVVYLIYNESFDEHREP